MQSSQINLDGPVVNKYTKVHDLAGLLENQNERPSELRVWKSVERILSILVSILYTDTMSSGFYQYITSFIVMGSIWNTCYLEYSHTLLVLASFTGITHYLYTIGFLVYLESINTHSTIKYVPKTFYMN